MAIKRLDRQPRKKRVMSTNQAQSRELPATHWAYAVAMLAETNRSVAADSNRQLTEDASVSDFDILRVRRLANQI